jgi:flagellar protein FlaG
MMRIEQCVAGDPAMRAGEARHPIPSNVQGDGHAEEETIDPKAVTHDSQQLERAIQAVNDFVTPMATSIEFRMDRDTGRTIIKVVDTKTNEVLRQIPNEEMLAIAKSLNKLQGLILRQKV